MCSLGSYKPPLAPLGGYAFHFWRNAAMRWHEVILTTYIRASQRGPGGPPGVHSAISGGPHKNAMSAQYECIL